MKNLNNVDYDEWKKVSESSPHATFFHTYAWAKILCESFPKWEIVPILLRFDNANSAIIPMMRYPIINGIRYYYESMVPGVYGGPIFRSNPSDEDWRYAWNSITQIPDIVMIGNPFSPNQGIPKIGVRTMFTHVLDLSPGYDQLRKGFRKGHRADIKAAAKKGLEVTIASPGKEVDSYYRIYQDALKRWGKEAGGFYPHELFHNIARHREMGKSLKLWLAHLGNDIVGGAWMLYHSDKVMYWHAAVQSKYFSYHPAHLILATVIEDACNKGYKWFDFNPSGGYEGVIRFKKGFGAQRIDFFSHRRLTSLGKAYRVFRRIKGRVFNKCPL